MACVLRRLFVVATAAGFAASDVSAGLREYSALRRSSQLVLDATTGSNAQAAATAAVEDFCGMWFTVYGPESLSDAGQSLAKGGQGEVFLAQLQDRPQRPLSAYERRVAHADAQVVVKRYAADDTRASAVETVFGEMLCSSVAPCPARFPFNAFLGTAKRECVDDWEVQSDCMYPVVIERARNGDLTALLRGGESAAAKASWESFVQGNSLIPGGVPELASARDLDAVLALLQQLANGLQHMKERGLMHRCVASWHYDHQSVRA